MIYTENLKKKEFLWNVMFKIIEKNIYRKELKSLLKQGKKPQKIFDVITMILNNASQGVEPCLLLPKKYRLHKLIGNYNGLWECHIEPDWVLVFDIDNNAIILERTGSHSDIFNKIRR